jgi:hypothetical protein
MAPASAEASAHETTRRIEDSTSHPRQPESGGAWLLQPLDTNSLFSQWPFFPSLSVSYHPTRWDGEPGNPERRLCPDGIGTKKRGSTAARPIRAQHHQPVCHQCAQPGVNLAHTRNRPSEKNRITEPFSCGGLTTPKWRRRGSNRIPAVVRWTRRVLSVQHLPDTAHGSVIFGVTFGKPGPSLGMRGAVQQPPRHPSIGGGRTSVAGSRVNPGRFKGVRALRGGESRPVCRTAGTKLQFGKVPHLGASRCLPNRSNESF